MLRTLKEIVAQATSNLREKIRTNPRFITTQHFQERLIQRFQEEDYDHLERTIEKAFIKAECGSKIRYTHPAYGITVVGQKMGLNGFELVTCWKGEK